MFTKRGMLLMTLILVPTASWAAVDLITASDGLMGPVLFLTKLMRYASYAVGGALCLGALAQYRLHRQNPKLTPLFTPILMVILGVILIFLPYISTMFGNSWSAEKLEEEGRGAEVYEPNKPATVHERSGQGYRHQKATPTAPQNGGHWTDQY